MSVVAANPLRERPGSAASTERPKHAAPPFRPHSSRELARLGDAARCDDRHSAEVDSIQEALRELRAIRRELANAVLIGQMHSAELERLLMHHDSLVKLARIAAKCAKLGVKQGSPRGEHLGIPAPPPPMASSEAKR